MSTFKINNDLNKQRNLIINMQWKYISLFS